MTPIHIESPKYPILSIKLTDSASENLRKVSNISNSITHTWIDACGEDCGQEVLQPLMAMIRQFGVENSKCVDMTITRDHYLVGFRNCNEVKIRITKDFGLNIFYFFNVNTFDESLLDHFKRGKFLYLYITQCKKIKSLYFTGLGAKTIDIFSSKWKDLKMHKIQQCTSLSICLCAGNVTISGVWKGLSSIHFYRHRGTMISDNLIVPELKLLILSIREVSSLDFLKSAPDIEHIECSTSLKVLDIESIKVFTILTKLEYLVVPKAWRSILDQCGGFRSMKVKVRYK